MDITAGKVLATEQSVSSTDMVRPSKMALQDQAREKVCPRQSVGASPVTSDGSVLSDSDTANFSSANSTLRSGMPGGKQTRTSHQKAIATLDLFLNDVSQMTEKAKQEEEKRLKQVKSESAPQQNAVKSPLSPRLSSSLTKKWISMPSVVSEEDAEIDSRLQKSLEDIRYVEYEVFSDGESDISGHEKRRKIYAQNKANKVNTSMSSEGSDAATPHMYGLTQLDHLRRFLEQFEHLQQQNSELTKRVTNLENNFTKRNPTVSEVSLSQRNSGIFALPKDRFKKNKATKAKPPISSNQHKDKVKGRVKTLAGLHFVSNMKQGSSQHLEKSKGKTARQKKAFSYAADDMEIGKMPHASDHQWRNSSVKSPSSKDAEKSFFGDEQSSEDVVDSPKQLVQKDVATPVVVATEEGPAPGSSGTVQPDKNPQSASTKKFFLLKPPQTLRSKSEERNYRKTKKMTEWCSLQQAFPTPQIESNLDLLNHLESIMSGHKPAAKKTGHHHGFMRPGRSKKVKSQSPDNMFLPSTEVPGFASTFLAAHAMANQLTLTLNLNELELMSTQEKDNSALPAGYNEPIQIS